MLGVGWTEMLLIGIVALIVIGPKDLPMLMGRLGKVVATIRRMGTEFQREINKSTGLDQITDLRRTITDPIKKTAAELTRDFNRMTPTGVEPSGVIKPSAPGAQSVVDEIHAAVGMPAAAASVAPVESPAPLEAIAPAKPKRARKAPAAAADQNDVPPKPARVRARPAPADGVVAKPRVRRAAKPKAEG